MISLFAFLAGSGIAAGIWIAFAGLRPAPAAPPRPPSRAGRWWRSVTSPPGHRRVLIAGVLGVVVLAVTRWPVAGIGAVAVVIVMPRMLSGREAAARIQRLDALEQWARKLAGLLGAAHGLEDALTASMLHTPAPIRAEVTLLGGRLRAGMTTDRALYHFADELNDPIADLVAAALVQAAERRGEGLRRVLADLAAMVAADVTNRREVQAERMPYLVTQRGVAVIFALFLAAMALRGAYAHPYSTTVGQVVLAAVLALAGLGFYALHRLASQPAASRFLTNPDQAKAATPPGRRRS